jgi:hypothetical protein
MLGALQEALAHALTSGDPVAAVAAAAANRGFQLTEAERAALRTVDQAGLELSALLILKLRLDQMLRADPELGARFDADPAGVSRALRVYHTAVPPGVAAADADAAAFRRWMAEQAND